MKEQVFDKLSKKWSVVIAITVFLILQYFICVNVFLMGDDFMYASFAKQGIIESVKGYYFTGNGRWFLNILDSLVLKFNRYVYVVILPWLLLALVVLLWKITVRITQKQNNHIFIVSLLLVSIIDISSSREIIYWITGGLNYLVPALLFLGSVDAVLILREKNDLPRWKKFLCMLVCIISSMTMEQFALMTIGWMTLLFGYDVYKEHKLEKEKVITYFISLLALTSIIFAPGNAVRIQNATESGNSIFIKLLDLFYCNYQSVQAAKFLAILSGVEGIILLRRKEKSIGFLAVINTVILVMMSVVPQIPFKIGLAIISVIVLVVTSCQIALIIRSECNLYYLVSLLILAVGSQVMLLTGDIWGFRTSFSVIIVYSLFITILYNLYDDDILFKVLLGCCAFYIYWIIGIIVIAVWLIEITTKNNIFDSSLCKVVPAIVISGCLISVALGYYKNRDIHVYNKEQVIECVLGKEKLISIKPYENEMYGWNSPPLSEFHERYFREYYGIPENTEIIYE